jgi:hypothetical protein
VIWLVAAFDVAFLLVCGSMVASSRLRNRFCAWLDKEGAS